MNWLNGKKSTLAIKLSNNGEIQNKTTKQPNLEQNHDESPFT